MTKWQVFKICANTILLLIAIMGEISFAGANINQLPVALHALGPVASQLSVLLKVLLLLLYRREIQTILVILKSRMEKGIVKIRGGNSKLVY